MGPQQRLQGQRPWPCVCRIARGLRQGQRLNALHQICTKASHSSGWLSCVAAPRRVDLDCEQVVVCQESGGDPTELWRVTCAQNLGRDYGIPPPGQVAAVFVAQWYLGALARAGAHLALAGPLLPVLKPGNVSIQRSGPGGHPIGVGLAADTSLLERGEFPDRLSGAEEDYRAHARRFMGSYEPGVKLGSRLAAWLDR